MWLWRHSAGMRVGQMGILAYGGAWLCQHLWKHYAFSGDRDFLQKRAYPIMKAQPCFLDWLTTDTESNLVTCPSTSPENEFVSTGGGKTAVALGSTMDLSLIWVCSPTALKQVKPWMWTRVSAEPGRSQRAAASSKNRQPWAAAGWHEDLEEASPGHRHLSTCLGSIPAGRFLAQTSVIKQACEVSIKRRIEHGAAVPDGAVPG